jgi:hypothetical protein
LAEGKFKYSFSRFNLKESIKDCLDLMRP